MLLLISSAGVALDTKSINWFLNHPNQVPEDSLDIMMNQFTYLNADTALIYLKYLDHKIGNTKSVLKISVQTYLSGVYSKMNNDKEFKYFNDMAIANATKIEAKSLLAKAYIVRAEHYKAQYLLDSVIYYCLKAEQSATQVNTFDLGAIYHTLGDVYYNLELYEMAEKYYLDVIKHSRAQPFWKEWRKIVVFTNLGDINTYLGDYTAANSYYRGALAQINQNKQSFAEYNDHIQIAHLYNRMALMFRSWNKLDTAKHYIDLAVQNLLKEPQLQYIYRYIYVTAGSIYSDLNYYSAAEAFLLDAEKELNKQSLGKLYECYQALADNYSKMEDYRKANEYYRKYDKAYREYWKRNNSATILQQKVLADFAKVNHQLQFEVIQKRIFLIAASILVVLLAIVVYYKHKLNKSYRELVNKTINLIDNSDKHHKELIAQSGIDEYTKNSDSSTDNPDKVSDNYTSTSEPQESLNDDLVDLAIKINELLTDNPIIHNPEFGINDLTDLMNSNRDYVSKAINGYYKVPFQIYINDLRVVAAIKLMREIPGNNYTMEYFMDKAGFNNRATFSKSFKRYTGLTPAVFYKTLHEDEQK